MALDQGVVELFEDLRASMHRWMAERPARPDGSSLPTERQKLVDAALSRVRPETVDYFCNGLIQLAHAASTLDEPDHALDSRPQHRGRDTQDTRTDQRMRSNA